MDRICVECNSNFVAKPSEVKRGGGKFCSHRCSSIYGNKIRSKTGIIVRCCSCNKELYRTQFRIGKFKRFFCNMECKRQSEFKGNVGKKRMGNYKRAHLLAKDKLIKANGIRCQFPNCINELFDDRQLIDMHHFGDAYNHSDTVLFCPYHHRLADRGYLKIVDGKLSKPLYIQNKTTTSIINNHIRIT